MVEYTIVWLVLTIVVFNGWNINQLNIHNVFLNETLYKEVHMQQPLGFVDLTLSSHVC
jgi:hypothetical protein